MDTENDTPLTTLYVRLGRLMRENGELRASLRPRDKMTDFTDFADKEWLHEKQHESEFGAVLSWALAFCIIVAGAVLLLHLGA